MRLFDFFQKKSETKKIDLSQISIDSSEDMANSKPIAESSHQNECHNAAPEPPNVHSDSENPDKKLERLSIFKSDIIKLVGYSGEDTQYTMGKTLAGFHQNLRSYANQIKSFLLFLMMLFLEAQATSPPLKYSGISRQMAIRPKLNFMTQN